MKRLRSERQTQQSPGAKYHSWRFQRPQQRWTNVVIGHFDCWTWGPGFCHDLQHLPIGWPYPPPRSSWRLSAMLTSFLHPLSLYSFISLSFFLWIHQTTVEFPFLLSFSLNRQFCTHVLAVLIYGLADPLSLEPLLFCIDIFLRVLHFKYVCLPPILL